MKTDPIMITPITSLQIPTQNSNQNHVLINESAVVLLSGGLDSVTCLYWAKARYAAVTAVSFDYGQRHNSELIAAKNIAQSAGVIIVLLISILRSLVALHSLIIV